MSELIGYDGMSEEEVEAYQESAYSPKELSRLGVFEHMIQVANEVESHLLNNAAQSYVFKYDDPKLKPSLMWDESWTLVNIIRTTALNMYISDFMKDEKMKEAANFILMASRQEKATSEEFEISELNALWDAP